MKELSVKRKGILTEEELKLWFLKQGFSVSVPIGDDDRYDFIVDFDGNKFHDLQCLSVMIDIFVFPIPMILVMKGIRARNAAIA